ncbi:hypothetical protein [Pseudonocardia spinosispora]|uniref:hypothetical protein n=1 Tax=Pseudonocardia spinosispora TaxID=103441 RepID=UPI00055BDEB3|nr:hypothetical protein [Pseudonocardia spinosispora]
MSRGSWKDGLGAMAAAMMALWLDPASGPSDADDLPRRISPGVLVIWTVLGIGIAAVIVTVKLVFGEPTPLLVWSMIAPMGLPLLMAFVHSQPQPATSLLLSIAAGAVTGVVIGLAAGSLSGWHWATFIGMAAGALAAAATFGMVALRHSR